MKMLFLFSELCARVTAPDTSKITDRISCQYILPMISGLKNIRLKKSRTANEALTRQKIIAAKRNFEAVKDEVGFCLTREESEGETTHNTAEAA